MVEEARLESVYTPKAYHGFESRSLRRAKFVPTNSSRCCHLGKMPEWSIGPHSKCGERATVPRVRIPVFPLLNV